MDLKEKNIVVTGGGQGLGLAMALEFAKAGANPSSAPPISKYC